MNRTISEVRNLINIASRHLLKEPTRKKIVEAYYANKANKLNRTAPTAPHSVDDIGSQRLDFVSHVQEGFTGVIDFMVPHIGCNDMRIAALL